MISATAEKLKSIKSEKDLADALNAVEVNGEDAAAEEDFVDPDAPTVTKVKRCVSFHSEYLS